MMDSGNDLRSVISSGNALLVVGAGASIAATKGAATASWLGLIRDGADFAVARDSSLARWKKTLDDQIQLAVDDRDGDQLLQAASQVAARIRKLGEQAFANWLEEAIGELSIDDTSWPEAIVKLGVPIFTTNYDKVLEKVGNTESASWDDPSAFQSILGGSGAIGHLHGIYSKPATVILSEADYQRQLDAEGIQAIQRAASATKSIIYVGCGGTLEDPNFSALLSWHRQLFVPSGVKHYRLCTTLDLEGLIAEHRDSNIVPIAIGDSHADLPNFLESLRPVEEVSRTGAGVIRDIVGESRLFLEEQLRQETIVGEGLPDLEDRSLDDLIVPPVLLPIPAQAYTLARDKPEKIDTTSDLKEDGVLLLVAEENSGLSTAVRWLLLRASTAREVPIVNLDFRRFGTGARPFERMVAAEARVRSLIARGDQIPVCVIGIDNFRGHSKTAERVSAELSSHPGLVIVGCTSANEADATDILRRSGVKLRVRYLGKLGSKQIRAMVELAAGSRADALFAAVSSTLRSEHLPRTPFTVALLVSVMSRGEAVLANASPTAVLDQYVNHLLGRDDASQDSRRALSAADRESILTDIATAFVEHDQGSLLQSDVIRRMEEFFSRFGWEESPQRVLGDLFKRRILTDDGAQVRFTQSSFLHLFAAKSAIKTASVRAKLLDRPLYYAPVLGAYAALVRSDQALLKDLILLIEHPPAPSENSMFANRPSREAPANLDQLIDRSFPEEEAESNVRFQTPDIDDPLESVSDSDILPFPVTDDHDLPPMIKFAQSLALVSVALRDSEEIEDLSLKQEALRRVLRGWGLLTDALRDDPSIHELVQQITSQLDETVDVETRDFVEWISKLMPSLMMFVSLQSSLASRKLTIIARQVADESEVKTDPHSAIPAALLLEAIAASNWEVAVDKLIEAHEHSEMVEDLISPILTLRYLEASDSSELETRLKNTVTRGYLARYSFPDHKQRNAAKSAYLQHLERSKRSWRRNSSPADAGELEEL